MSTTLYNRDILALAVATAAHPLRPAVSRRATARAPLCGSRITLDLDVAADGRVASVGLHVEACALGQAAATLLARHAPGRRLDELRVAKRAITDWFAGSAVEPDWPDFQLLAAARDFPARHGAILLPFEAAIAAFETQVADA